MLKSITQVKEKEKLYVTVTIFRFENDEENGK